MSSVKKKKKQSAFMRWYTSYSGKNAVNVVYSLGASVVIVGALFKIMHWPGASIVLTAGMVTEAFLFVIGVLEHPHEEYHWGNVFPQLLEVGTEPDRLDVAAHQVAPTMLGAGGVGENVANAGQTSASGSHSEMVLKDEDFKKIKESLQSLNQTAGQLSDLGGIVGASSKLKEKMERVCDSTDQFLSTQDSLKGANDAYIQQIQALSSTLNKHNSNLNSSYEDVVGEMQNVVKGTKNYTQQLSATEKNVSALNAAYELQLNVIEQQINDVKKQTSQMASVSKIMDGVVGDMTKIESAISQSLKNHDSYLQQTEILNKQLSDLNKVYGNMLNALS